MNTLTMVSTETIFIFLFLAGGIPLIIALINSLINVGKDVLASGVKASELSVEFGRALKDGIIDNHEKEKLLKIVEELRINLIVLEKTSKQTISKMNRIVQWFINRT